MLNLRLQPTDGVMLKRQNVLFLFLLVLYSAKAQEPVRYEYWMDADYGTCMSGNSAEGNVDLTLSLDGCTPGLHFLNFRAMNTAGEVGPLFRTLFYLPPVRPADGVVTGYEQWFDNDYAHKILIKSLSSEPVFTLNVDDLAPGVHFLNIWAQNSAEVKGVLYRTLFYLPEQQCSDVAEYEYWFDNDTLNKVKEMGCKAEYVFRLDVSKLISGKHTFSFRASNSIGEWGPLHVDTFDLSEMTSVESLKNEDLPFDVYNLAGVRVLTNVSWKELCRLPASIYIVRGRKVLVR